MAQRAREYQPGERVPGTVYEVVRLIGAGGMGTVYDVEDTTIGKRYVLKALHPQLCAREDLARRMQNEARQLARLNHSNIVEVFTAGVTSDDLRLPYYVMERLSGQSLRVVLEKKGQLELSHAFKIGIDLLDALDHAHDKGVIHRDVKPDNIFLHRTPAGITVTKLLDFGIVSVLDASIRETAGRFLGTLRYAAPEQLRGERPTPKVDLYAAGLVLYEIIAGRGPFDEEGDPHAIGAAHMEKPAPLLSRFVAVSDELEGLIMGALAKAPEARPRDAFSFASSLRALKRDLSGPRPRESTEDRATSPAVIGGESPPPPYVEVRQSSPDGPYVISPGRRPPASAQTGLPKTTLPGAPQATLGPPLADPMTAAPTATSPDLFDRMAATSSLAPATVAPPPNGTEAFNLTPRSGTAAAASVPPRSHPDSPFHWPDERATARSEEPQIQTLSAPLQRSPRAPPWGLAAATAAAITMLSLFFFALHAPSKKPVAGGPSPLVAPTAPPPAIPRPVESAPVVASAWLPSSLPNEAATGSSGAKAPSPPARGKSRPAGSSTKSTAYPLRADRPGPGF
jgi:eukaryotic-like serine/threonine-protein kinase